MKARKCIIKTCENPATPRTPYCSNCGSGINRWFHRRPAERLIYRQKLAVRSERMDIALEGKK